MREIKFRAWVEDFDSENGEKKESVMFYSTEANTTEMKGDRKLVCCGDDIPLGVLESFLKNSRTPVMQYTGLKDKNGKEIYEGDVVRIPDDYEEYGFMAGEQREVYYFDGCFRLKPKKENTIDRGNTIMDDMDKCEIIGNIYENQELLNPHTT